jgi:hypothetical protein
MSWVSPPVLAALCGMKAKQPPTTTLFKSGFSGKKRSRLERFVAPAHLLEARVYLASRL